MKTITFLIPVYNEEKRINKTINALKEVLIPVGLKLEKIIFVSDGSKDGTVKILKTNKKTIETKLKVEVKIVSYTKNMGKGYAVKTGMAHSASDYTLFFDADMATPLTELTKFMPFINKGDDVIIGTRKNGKSTVVKHQPLYRELMGRVYTLISKTMLNTWVTDFTCGFKAFSKKAKNEIFSRALIDRWGYDSELLFLAGRLGYKISEKAVTWTDDRNTKVNLFKSVFTSFYELVKIRFYDITGKYSLNTVQKLALHFSNCQNMAHY